MITPAAARYFSLIEATLRDGLANFAGAVEVDDDHSFAMAWALPAVADRLGFECSAVLRSTAEMMTKRAAPAGTRFIDGAGHSRPPYATIALRSLGIKAAVTSPQPTGNVIDAIFRVWPSAAPEFRSMSVPLMPSMPTEEEGTSETLMLREEGIATLRRMVRDQQPDGTFLPRSNSDSLEPQWYDELAILHALSCYASESGDAEVDAAVRRAVKYHAAETQPDHASTHPWAIAAFLDEPDAIPLADMMLHAAGVQQPRMMDAVSLLLLADALDCGRQLATR